MLESEPVSRGRGRPKNVDDAGNTTRDMLIRSGLEMLTGKGYSATGLDSVLKRAGIPKGSFYHYFKSKEDFCDEIINNYAAYFAHKLDKHLLFEKKAPLQRLSAFMNDAIRGMELYQFRRGCLIGNLGQEIEVLPDNLREKLQLVFKDWQKRVSICLEQAKLSGQISKDVDCKQAAYLFWIGWEGAILRSRLERSSKALKAFKKYYLASLNNQN